MYAGVVWAAFVATYVVMATGRLPGLRIDRTGMAVLAAAGVVLLTEMEGTQLAWLEFIEWPVLIGLFSLMLLGACFESAGGFERLASVLLRVGCTPRRLLLAVVVLAGGLSVVLVNDIVVYALVPVLCMVCKSLGYRPVAHLLALAFSANAGSAASTVGNPQNILIAEIGDLSFASHFIYAALPSVMALFIIYAVVAIVFREDFRAVQGAQPCKVDTSTRASNSGAMWASSLSIALVIIAYLVQPAQGYLFALGVSVLMLALSPKPSVEIIKKLDIPLLMMIAALFVVTGAFANLPAVGTSVHWAASSGFLPSNSVNTLGFSVLASNTIGNVPAVMLLLEVAGDLPANVLHGLALFSTLSGNLLLTGSLANIIVAERSAALGIRLGFVEFLKVGVPITVASLAFAFAWVY